MLSGALQLELLSHITCGWSLDGYLSLKVNLGFSYQEPI